MVLEVAMCYNIRNLLMKEVSVMNNIREICTFGFAYSCVIGFCLFGPLTRIIIGENTFLYTILALSAFVLSFVNPFFRFFTKRGMTIAHTIFSIFWIFSYPISLLKELVVFLFAFEIATLCRSFTLHVLEKIEPSQSERVMASSFFIAFSTLYLMNMLEPVLSVEAAIFIAILLSSATVFFNRLTVADETIAKKYDKTFDRSIFLPLISLYLVYIGGGISYAGIYPYLETFYSIDRFYNVLPLILFMPVAGLIGKKFGNLINLFIGMIFLSISFTCFMFPLSEINYYFVQTFLQIGWAFTNVFGFSYSWHLATNHANPYLFGYGILFILLGVISGSIIANFIVTISLPKAFFGPFTFTPLIVSLIFQFFYNDTIPGNVPKTNCMESEMQHILYGKGLEFSNFRKFSVLSELTEREREIIYYYYYSETAVKISDRLKVSPNTVRTHIKNSYSKLGISKREQLQDLINHHYEDKILHPK